MNKKSEIKIEKHPLEQYKNKWKFFKWLFFVTVIIGLSFDLFFDSFFDPKQVFQFFRISLAMLSIILFCLLLILEYICFNKKTNNSQMEIDREIWKDVFDNYKHADDLYHQRFNFFLVAESMLIVSFVTTLLVANNSELFKTTNYIRIAISVLGMVFTFSWFYVNKRLCWRLSFLNNEFLNKKIKVNNETTEHYKNYLRSVDKYATIPTGFFLSGVLPAFTFAFWYFLFYITRWQLFKI